MMTCDGVNEGNQTHHIVVCRSPTCRCQGCRGDSPGIHRVGEIACWKRQYAHSVEPLTNPKSHALTELDRKHPADCLDLRLGHPAVRRSEERRVGIECR